MTKDEIEVGKIYKTLPKVCIMPEDRSHILIENEIVFILQKNLTTIPELDYAQTVIDLEKLFYVYSCKNEKRFLILPQHLEEVDKPIRESDLSDFFRRKLTLSGLFIEEVKQNTLNRLDMIE